MFELVRTGAAVTRSEISPRSGLSRTAVTARLWRHRWVGLGGVPDADLSVEDRLAETVNYEMISRAAQDLAAHGHWQLVETFAQRLAEAMFTDARVSRARVRVEKPTALAPVAEAAGVEVILVRA